MSMPMRGRFKLGKIGKVNIAWGILFVGGIASFFAVRDNVHSKRVNIMKSKQRIKEANMADAEERLKQRGAAKNE